MFLFPHTVYSPAHTNKHTCKHLQDKLDQSESKCWYKKVITLRSASSSETNVFYHNKIHFMFAAHYTDRETSPRPHN